MPLYEYRCVKCHTHFEKIRKYSDPPFSKCEKCGGKLEQLLSSPAFKFKGTGWYVTDYARKPSDGEKEKADKDKPDVSPSGKSETAAESKKEKTPSKEATKPAEPATTSKSSDAKSRSRK